MHIPETIHLSSWLFFFLILIYVAIDIAAVAIVIKENRNPIRALSWVIALLFLPGIGLIFYIFFGRSLRGKVLSQTNRGRLLHMPKGKEVKLSETALSTDLKNLVMLGIETDGYPLTINNNIEIFTEGKEKFDSLTKDLLRAKKRIYLQYYIFLDDKIGNRISKILIEKAREGVEVKVIYDHVGSFSARNKFFKRMADNGVEVHPFFRVNFPQFANRINWRNHRKIVIIDDEIGYIGGMNIADRYAYGERNGKESWRDTHFRVKGEIIQSLTHSFILDWNFQIKGEPYIPERNPETELKKSTTGMQLVTGGPMCDRNNLSLMFLKAITTAKKLIWIQTPYFLPTDALFNALEAAALSKIDVRIMMPAHTDSLLLHYSSFSYISQCLKAGIKIYLYQPGMLHAKAMIIDEDLVTAGSTNFDFRSFENNFECNLFIHDREFNKRMRDIFYSDMEKCQKVTKEMWGQRSIGHKFLESILRLVSPIL